jgi:predicted nucleotidyltransferase
LSSFEASARRAAAVLDGVPFALVGGFAVTVRTEPRFTRDLDLAVAVVDDAGAEGVLRSFVEAGYSLSAEVDQTAVDRIAIARLHEPDGDGVTDLLFASSGIEPELVAAAEAIEVLPGLVLPVATVGHLIALKLLARDDDTRPQDAGDLRALAAVATAADRIVASEAVQLIEARGFSRGRSLAQALEELLGT